jgi:TetR/AcrR family transcriptional regulator, transcriptional repressor for nem operon
MQIMQTRRSPPDTAARFRRPAPTAAAQAILDIAEQLVQTRGFNGMSYADVAAQLGVTKASLHYHFPSKEELGCALIERYHAHFDAALDAIGQQESGPREKLRQYAALYQAVLNNERMCLCGMLAAEYATLPAAMQKRLTSFFDANERWLAGVLRGGLRAGVFRFHDSPDERARLLLGALEGAMLIARSYGDPRRFSIAVDHVLADIEPHEDSTLGRKPRAGAAPPRPTVTRRRSSSSGS